MTSNKTAGVAALLMALIYIGAFVYFGALLGFPDSKHADVVMPFLAQHHHALWLVYFMIYVAFGVLLAVLVEAIETRLGKSPTSSYHQLLRVGTLFGKVWVCLVIASGMIATIGMSRAIGLMEESNEEAFRLWGVVSMLVESLGGGNELVGGLWVLVISIVALQRCVFTKVINYLGCVVGVAGIATVYPADVFTEIFGLTQIIWFSCVGVSLIKSAKQNGL